MPKPIIVAEIPSARVSLYFPDEWGDPFTIIDAREGHSLHDIVWKNFIRRMEAINQSADSGCGLITDETNGFATHTIEVCVVFDDDTELLTATIERMKHVLHVSYMDIPRAKRLLCKKTN